MRDKDGRNHPLYPYRKFGSTTVRCKNCGQRGATSQRLVGRARTIEKCGQCLRDLTDNRSKGNG